MRTSGHALPTKRRHRKYRRTPKFRLRSERSLRLKNALGFVVFLILAISSLGAIIFIAGGILGVSMPERQKALTIHAIGTQD